MQSVQSSFDRNSGTLMGRLTFWKILGLGTLVVGGAGYVRQTGNVSFGPEAAGGGAAIAAPGPVSEKIVAVEAEPAASDTVIEEIRAVGTLRANEAVIVAPELPGRIARFGFAEGDRVEAGNVLDRTSVV